jgi:hypothetical protein
MYQYGSSIKDALAATQKVWTVFHVVVFFLMLVNIEPPVNRALWVFDVHAALWLALANVWAEVYFGDGRVWITAIIVCIIDVVTTAEMDVNYIDFARTAITLRAILYTSLMASIQY